MNRDIESKVFSSFDTHRGVCLELVTGYGKSRLAILSTKRIPLLVRKEEYKILIVVDRKLQIPNWKEEVKKWGGFPENFKVTYVCYASLKKHVGKRYDTIVYDEAHHLYTDSRMESFSKIFGLRYIFLSATIQYDFKKFLKKNNVAFYTINLVEAINEGVIPEPRIIKVPMVLGTELTELIIKHPNSKLPPVYCEYKDMFVAQKKYPNPIHIKCTPKQYLNYIDNMMEFYKRKHMEQPMLRMGVERLKWLSEQREEYTLSLLKDFKGYRTLTFCSSIEQTERLGKNCIHSKNKKANSIYEDFNAGKIKHITSCAMLNEGMNLKNCRICIFANYNASETKCVQRVGRALRHKHPIIIMPYFVNSREEQIVNNILKDYDKNLIETAKHGNFEI